MSPGNLPEIIPADMLDTLFYQAFFFLFFRQLISELAKWNSAVFGHMVAEVSVI